MLWGYYTTNSNVYSKYPNLVNLITPDNDYEGSVNSYAHVDSYSWDETTQCTILMFNSKTTLNVETDSFVGNLNTESMRSLNVTEYGSFKVGEEILVHISTGTGESTSDKTEILGRCEICTIYKRDLIENKQALWINLNLENLFGSWDTFNQIYTMQIVTVPFFNDVTISEGCQLVPAKWNGKCGGILIFKAETVHLAGGHINLYNRGLNDPAKRRLLRQEKYGTLDTDTYSGWENDDTATHCVLNSGDGVFILFTDALYIDDITSRIGNPDLSGVSYCRGASDTPSRFHFDTTNISNIGGSTIFIKSRYYHNFIPSVIAKYRSPKSLTDKGLARCCLEIRWPSIKRPNFSFWEDGGLYSWRNYSNRSDYLNTYTNIKDFGKGTLTTSLADTQLNNYASIAKIDGASLWVTKNTSTKIYKTTNGQIPFAVGTLVMLHFSSCSRECYFMNHGRFIVCRITNILENYDSNTDAYLVDKSWSIFQKREDGTYGVRPDLLNKTYSVQMISIPEYDSLSLKNQQFGNLAMKFASDKNTTTPGKLADIGGYGGIVAIAVKNTLNIEGTKLLVTNAGGSRNPDTKTPVIGNTAMYNKLPIGEGHGSIFLLAKHIKMDNNTRLGSMNTGSGFGGYGGTNATIDTEETRIPSGGYRGHDGRTQYNKQAPVYGGSPDQIESLNGSGSAGGYYGNGSYTSITSSTNHFDHAAAQGAHLFIVADSITGFNQNAIATGGEGGEYAHYGYKTSDSFIPSDTFNPTGSADSLKANNKTYGFAGGPGGAGYGGGGASGHPESSAKKSRSGSSGGFIRGGNGGTCGACGITGCSGGGTGWAFIYCNHAIGQNTTGTIVD